MYMDKAMKNYNEKQRIIDKIQHNFKFKNEITNHKNNQNRVRKSQKQNVDLPMITIQHKNPYSPKKQIEESKKKMMNISRYESLNKDPGSNRFDVKIQVKNKQTFIQSYNIKSDTNEKKQPKLLFNNYRNTMRSFLKDTLDFASQRSARLEPSSYNPEALDINNVVILSSRKKYNSRYPKQYSIKKKKEGNNLGEAIDANITGKSWADISQYEVNKKESIFKGKIINNLEPTMSIQSPRKKTMRPPRENNIFSNRTIDSKRIYSPWNSYADEQNGKNIWD